ncbi:Choline-sulfatase [Pirellula sp. SH-Sr6A]|uniref:sulfatase n=1 Tax=Pirellula sp. SH-Sr6A TaxID=1632865 RepID=UPI00078E0758|nr:sulfatase [Pirellula sp. SH-Sr6A]AMV34295.1 Choline-sulfatase [Pirellula sp. SH-Sr6A]
MRSVMLSCLFAVLCLLSFGGRIYSADRPNVLFIAIDDLRCDLGSMDVPYAKTPQLDAFAQTARVFTRHYVQVPTCGASRCALLRGRYPTVPSQINNGGIAQTHKEWGHQSLPTTFRRAGYKTLALGKITHHPGGRTGKEWRDGPEELPGAWDHAWIPDGPWESPEAIMHGYADGARRRPGKSLPWESQDGPDESYPDAWVAKEAIQTLEDLSKQQEPWFFGVGFFKPHLPFAAPKRWYDLHADGIPDLNPLAAMKPKWPSTWHKSGELRGNYGHEPGRDPDTDAEYARLLRRAYAACVSYMDAQVGKVLKELERLGLDDNTIVVIWSDHGFLLGEHAIWGKHCLYENALRSPLMIRHPDIKQPGKHCDAIVETIDVFPTLTELCSLEAPATLDGRSLVPQLADPSMKTTKPAVGFWGGGQRTVRTDRWRMIVSKPNGEKAPQVELFDYETDPEETNNHADANPAVVAELLQLLSQAP